MRVAVADDVMLIRSGLAWLLRNADIEVVGEASDAEQLQRIVALERPDVAIIDIKMPPTMTDEGLVAARTIRRTHPQTAVILLSQYVEVDYARQLFADQPGGVGYLLKERVSDIAVLVEAVHRVAEGECVLDPTIVARVMKRDDAGSPLRLLTAREREVLNLMAQGRSNAAIAGDLWISSKTVEAMIAQIFRKLGLPPSPDVNRRVLAVLTLVKD